MYSYSDLHARAERVEKLIIARQRRLSSQAGLDPGLLGIHPHNAMCSFNAGRPWRNVDYSLVRQILWLQRERQFRPYALVRSLYERGRTYFERGSVGAIVLGGEVR